VPDNVPLDAAHSPCDALPIACPSIDMPTLQQDAATKMNDILTVNRA
jgi:hypothetical protein